MTGWRCCLYLVLAGVLAVAVALDAGSSGNSTPTPSRRPRQQGSQVHECITVSLARSMARRIHRLQAENALLRRGVCAIAGGRTGSYTAAVRMAALNEEPSGSNTSVVEATNTTLGHGGGRTGAGMRRGVQSAASGAGMDYETMKEVRSQLLEQTQYMKNPEKYAEYLEGRLRVDYNYCKWGGVGCSKDGLGHVERITVHALYIPRALAKLSHLRSLNFRTVQFEEPFPHPNLSDGVTSQFFDSWHHLTSLRLMWVRSHNPVRQPSRFPPSLEKIGWSVPLSSNGGIRCDWASARRLKSLSAWAQFDISGITEAPALKNLMMAFVASDIPSRFPKTLRRLVMLVKGDSEPSLRQAVDWAAWCQDLRTIRINGNAHLEMLDGLSSCANLTDFRLLHVPNLRGTTDWDGQLPPGVYNLDRLEVFQWYNVTGTAPRFVLPRSKRLMSVDLDRNRLSSIPPNLHLKRSLEIFSAAHNRIATLPAELSNLNKLKVLRLGFNMISETPPPIVEWMDAVLHRNHLHNQFNSGGSNLTSVENVHLREVTILPGNPIVDESLHGNENVAYDLLAELVELGVESERVMRSQKGLCDPGGIYRCGGHGTGGDVSIRDLIKVDLSGLNLFAAPLSLVNISSSNVFVDMSKNQLRGLPSEYSSIEAKKLDLSSNNLQSFPAPLLGARVRTLNLAKNYDIKQWPARLPGSPLCRSMVEVDISEAGLVEIPTSLDDCKKLERLVAIDNKISKINLSWSRLHTLILDGNLLTASSVDGLSMNALVVSLASNSLDRWPDLTYLAGLVSDVRIHRLDLSHNKIKRITDLFGVSNRWPMVLSYITDLHLDHNELEYLPDRIFTTPLFANNLDLSHNKIRSIPPTIHLARHDVIDLSHNMIEDFPVASFAGSNATAESVIAEIERIGRLPSDEQMGSIYGSAMAQKSGTQKSGTWRAFPKSTSHLRLDHNRMGALTRLGAATAVGLMRKSLAEGNRFVLSLMGNPKLDVGALVVPSGAQMYVDAETLRVMAPPGSAEADDQLAEMIRNFDQTDSQRAGLEENKLFNMKLGGVVGAKTLAANAQVASFETLSHRDGFNDDVLKDCWGISVFMNGRTVVFARCLCISGFYESRTDALHCRQCPRFADCNRGRIRCPRDRYLKHLMVDPENLTITPDVECPVCPEGGVCDGTSVVVPTKGHWQDPSNSDVFHSCANTDACLGGTESECAAGYTGVLCGMCEHGYYSSGAHECSRCPAVSISILVMVLGCCGIGGSGVVLFMLAASMLNRERALRKVRISEGGAMLTQSTKSMRAVMASFTSLKSSVSFLQVVSSLSVTFDVPWPSMIGLLDGLFGWVNLDIMRSTSFECVWELMAAKSGGGLDESAESAGFGYAQRMVIAVAVIASVSLSLWLLYGMTPYLPLARRHGQRGAEDLRRTIMQITVLVWHLGYLPVSYLAIQYFHCVSYDGGSTFYIVNDLSTKCYHGDYWAYGAVALAAIALYTFGLPMAIFGIGLRRSGALDSVLSRYQRGDPTQPDGTLGGVLCQGYHPQYQWWDALEMMRRVTVGGFVVLLSGSSLFQLSVAMAVIFIFTILHYRCWPNITQQSNVTQAVFLVLTYFTMSLGVLRSLEVPREQRDMFAGVVLLLDIVVLLGLVMLVVHDMARVMVEKIASKWSKRFLTNK